MVSEHNWILVLIFSVATEKQKRKGIPPERNPNPREREKKLTGLASGSPAKDAVVTAASILSIPMRTNWGIGKKM